MGRPSLYTPELIETIASRLSKGVPMAVICRDEGMPDPATVWRWAEGDATISQAIAHARLVGFDAIADECLEIADDSRNDFILRLAEQGDEASTAVAMANTEHIQRSKLRIETRLKLLSKWDPKRYGDRMTLAGDNDAPLLTTPDAQIDARLAELLAKGSM